MAASITTSAPPATRATRNGPLRRLGRWGKSVDTIASCATLWLGTAA
jgi:hypothetical protein